MDLKKIMLKVYRHINNYEKLIIGKDLEDLEK